MPGTMLEPGEIVRIPFPFSDLATTKRRPVLALTPADEYGDFIGVAITSKSASAGALPIGAADLARGALPLASWVRPTKLFTITATLASEPVAAVTPQFRQQVLDALCQAVTS